MLIKSLMVKSWGLGRTVGVSHGARPAFHSDTGTQVQWGAWEGDRQSSLLIGWSRCHAQLVSKKGDRHNNAVGQVGFRWGETQHCAAHQPTAHTWRRDLETTASSAQVPLAVWPPSRTMSKKPGKKQTHCEVTHHHLKKKSRGVVVFFGEKKSLFAPVRQKQCRESASKDHGAEIQVCETHTYFSVVLNRMKLHFRVRT